METIKDHDDIERDIKEVRWFKCGHCTKPFAVIIPELNGYSQSFMGNLLAIIPRRGSKYCVPALTNPSTFECRHAKRRLT